MSSVVSVCMGDQYKSSERGVARNARVSNLDLEEQVSALQMKAVAKKCGDKWHDFGLHLEIEMGELDDIQERHRDSLSNRLMKVLHSWSLREGQNATVGKLIDISTKVRVRGAVVAALQSES